MKRIVVLSLAVLLVLGVLIGTQGEALAGGKKIVVGAKNFTEQYVVGKMMVLLLKENGFKVKERMGTGSSVTRSGFTSGQIDIYPEYTGTAWTVYLKHEEKVNDPDELYEKVKTEDMEKNGVVWFSKSGVNNTYALAILASDRGKYGDSLSDLAEYVNSHPGEVKLATNQNFYERSDGFKNMKKAYGMNIPNEDVKLMDIGLTFEAIARGQVDVAMVFATDAKLKKYDMMVLEDDKLFFPTYNLCVVTSKAVLERYPELTEIMNPIAELDNETMQRLNYEVEVDGKPAEMVAEEFLKSKGLIK